MQELEERIGYNFKKKELLEKALTHSSYANEQQAVLRSNERLEFLGDSVLGFISAEYFYKNNETKPEGDLTKLRAAAVCEPALCAYAKSLDLGGYLKLGKGEANTGGRERPSIIADAFEALLAAVYLDGGLAAAKKFGLKFITKPGAENPRGLEDYKTILQEVIQKKPFESLKYFLINETGPDHDKLFEAEVRLNGDVIGRGEGRSKKLAEQQAAKSALEELKIEN
ncbi:MAG: ribonuclease III [Oscillospiraceae bacterium]|nr:ribonuclease III [Oscillospiraceae bacterium]